MKKNPVLIVLAVLAAVFIWNKYKASNAANNNNPLPPVVPAGAGATYPSGTRVGLQPSPKPWFSR